MIKSFVKVTEGALPLKRSATHCQINFMLRQLVTFERLTPINRFVVPTLLDPRVSGCHSIVFAT